MLYILAFALLCFDLGGLLALGHIECGWKIPILDP